MKTTEIEILIQKFLQGNAAQSEIQELVKIFNNPQQKANLFEVYAQKWENPSHPLDSNVTRQMFSDLEQKIKTKNNARLIQFNWRKLSRIAVIIILPFLAGALFFKVYNQFYDASTSKDMVVAVGKRQKAAIQLPDGTSVWLNSNTTLSYNKNFNKSDRRVKIQGEAYFDVVKDKSRPFIVQSGNFQAKVLGTSFNFKAYPNDNQFSICLVRGSVLVSNLNHSTQLQPNEKATFDRANDKLIKTKLYNVSFSGMWRNDELAFEQESLGNIANVLERMYPIRIRFKSENLKSIKFTGRVKTNEYKELLRMISVTAPIDISIKDSTIYLSEDTAKQQLYR